MHFQELMLQMHKSVAKLQGNGDDSVKIIS